MHGNSSFSRTHNRITFFGVSESFDFQNVGLKLIDFALKQLDYSKHISANILRGDLEPLLKEKLLYQKFGFVEFDNSIFEAGVPACMIQLSPNYLRAN